MTKKTLGHTQKDEGKARGPEKRNYGFEMDEIAAAPTQSGTRNDGIRSRRRLRHI